MNFRQYLLLKDEEVKIVSEDYAFYVDVPLMESVYLSEKRTEAERKVVRARKHALQKATDFQFDTWDNIQKAKWLSRWEFKYFSGEKSKFVKRDRPLDWKKIFMKMKKAKKMLRIKGERIRKKAQQQLLRRRNITRGPNQDG